eukprot:scaffold674110_cov28-Prasinocladus_malaysianus.AAC.1
MHKSQIVTSRRSIRARGQGRCAWDSPGIYEIPGHTITPPKCVVPPLRVLREPPTPAGICMHASAVPLERLDYFRQSLTIYACVSISPRHAATYTDVVVAHAVCCD